MFIADACFCSGMTSVVVCQTYLIHNSRYTHLLYITCPEMHYVKVLQNCFLSFIHISQPNVGNLIGFKFGHVRHPFKPGYISRNLGKECNWPKRCFSKNVLACKEKSRLWLFVKVLKTLLRNFHLSCYWAAFLMAARLESKGALFLL